VRTARPAAQTRATGPGHPPPRRARHAVTPRAPAVVPPDHPESSPARTGPPHQRRGCASAPTPARGQHPLRCCASAGTTPPAGPACGSPRRTRARHHRSAWGAPRPPPGAASDAEPGTSWRGREAQGARLLSPGAVGQGRLFSRASPGSNAAPSSPTPKLTCCRKRKRSGRCRQSGAAPCSAGSLAYPTACVDTGCGWITANSFASDCCV